MLPHRHQVGGRRNPSLPLILAAWHYASNDEKMERFAEHLKWAERHDEIAGVANFLSNLSETDWHHVNDWTPVKMAFIFVSSSYPFPGIARMCLTIAKASRYPREKIDHRRVLRLKIANMLPIESVTFLPGGDCFELYAW
jgi:hypothetical protein